MAQQGMETYVGIIRTPADAITLFEACRLGLLPRVCRRLSEKERQQIKSGSVFVWDEREAGMRRWTDGKSWSASRVSGSFLTYREMEGKRSGGGSTFASRSGRTPDGSRNSDDGENDNEQPDGYRYKPDGLMKQSFSITTSTAQHLHLISYFSRNQQAQHQLKQPTQDPSLRHLKPAPGMYPESSVTDSHSMPAVTRSPMAPAGAATQTPSVAGYARVRYASQPPLHHGSLPPGYGPPPPGYGPPPQVAINGYGHPHYSPHPPHAYPGYPPHYAGPPPPPGPQHPHQGHSSYPGPAPPGQLPALSRNDTPPGDLRSSHRRTGSGSSYQQQYYPSPRTGYAPLTPQPTISSHPSQGNSPNNTPPGAKLDLRLTVAPSPLSQNPNSPNALHAQYVSGNGGRRSASPHLTPPTSFASQPMGLGQASYLPQPPPTSAPSQPSLGTNIPSIQSLVNGASQYDHHRSRSGSGSPSSAYRNREAVSNGDGHQQGPRDIPNDKLSFGEDRRALNVLNKAFQT